jgi:two-component system response regulator FlrC
MTAYGTVEHAVNAMKEGAFDYIQKPFDTEALYGVVQRALGSESGNIVCSSRSMQEVLMRAQQVAKSDVTVFVMGESGVGKELVSRYIHENGDRREMPFVAVNCAALPENLLESELFGYEKGAFTGAATRKPGKFELADGGTILLDEVTEMDLRLQAKLLRVLQEREVEVIGSRYPKKVNVKVIATTNRNINRLVDEGKFREDLYYRLNVFPIVVPPLRERREDIPQLVECLLKKYARGMDTRVEKEAMNRLIQRSWRGNVRELENAIARACILSDYSVIKVAHLEDPNEEKESVAALSGDAVGSVKEMEMKLILDALKSMNGNRTRAASVLGITARTLRNKIKEYRELGLAVP